MNEFPCPIVLSIAASHIRMGMTTGKDTQLWLLAGEGVRSHLPAQKLVEAYWSSAKAKSSSKAELAGSQRLGERGFEWP